MKRPATMILSAFAVFVVSRAIGEERWLLPDATRTAAVWRYTLEKPAGEWTAADFDDASWKQGKAGFGSEGTPGAVIGTPWETNDVWLRTAFDFDGEEFNKAAICVHHDEDVSVFVNRQKVFSATWYIADYELYDVTPAVRKALRKGRNVVAVCCHQTTGGQYVDVGLVLDPKEELLVRPDLPLIKPLFDYPVRDTSVCVGGDGNYYLTGTTGHPTWWKTNEGIRVWKSPDLKKWEPLGLVWRIEDGTWQKQMHGENRALWAPDIHFINGTYWITFCMNFGGTGLLKSTSGKAEGPYVDVHPQGPVTDKIDASLFQDDDGKVYYVWQNGMIAQMNDEMTGLAEKPRLLKPANHNEVGFEGAYLTKKGGKYYLICADFIGGLYHCMVAESDRVYGPYGLRYLAIPHGGHNMFFTDKAGNWWATFFGNDPRAPFRERPALLIIELNDDGRVRPKTP
jgi:xylan 1,4-beta-xylosidase